MLLYTDFVRQVVTDMASRLREFQHLDPERIGFLAAARSSGSHANGNLATCYALETDYKPMISVWLRPGTRKIVALSDWFQFRAPRVRLGGRDMSYLILLRLPRLLISNPLPTLIHELYHIGEGFDRSLRPDRHGPDFDRTVRRLTQTWLASAKGDLPRIAQMRLCELEREFGAVLAQSVPSRMTIPLVEPVATRERPERAVARLYPDCQLSRFYEFRPTEFSSEDCPRVLTEKDLILRHYSRRGGDRLPPAFARYSRRYLALSA